MKFGDSHSKEVARRQRRELASEPRTVRLATFPESDPRFDKVPTKRTDEVISYRGFCCECSKPHYQWTVTRAPANGDIPVGLIGSFTNRERLLAAIDSYLKTEKEKQG